MKQSRIIVVSNRLPVNISEEAGGLVLKRSLGGLATALSSVMETYPMIWIGWAGSSKKLTKLQIAKLQFPDKLVDVAISAKLFNQYYNRIANGMLWPILHGIKPTRLSKESDWQATQEVVTRFADRISEQYRSGDCIWIHDYHLVLLPKLLRDRQLSCRIGFFLHTPFPPKDTFMRWLYNRELLESLSQVDVLGFQTVRDADNFKECLKAVGFRMKRGATVREYPIGVDYEAFSTAKKIRVVGRNLKRFKQTVIGKKVILSVSRLDYTKGLIQQLRAVEKVLESYRPGKIVYKLVVAPSREDVAGYQNLRDEVQVVVEEINRKFKKTYGYKPIDYEYRSNGFEELSAWYRIADLLLVTPTMDGMNLVVKEYIAAREDYRGMVVISKTIGAAFQLKEALLVDPENVDEISLAIHRAFNMPTFERRRRWQALRKIVKQQDVFWWTQKFLADLTQVDQKQYKQTA